MSQTNQLFSKAIELQQNTLENSQRAMERAIELPVKGTVDFQRNAAQLMLDSLEMGNWVSNQGVELTRNALDTYLTTVENAASDTTQLAEQGIERAGDAGQQSLASTRQFATAMAGNGSQADGTGAYLPGIPQQQPRQPPQDQSQAGGQYQPPAAPQQYQPPAAPQQQAPERQQRPPTTQQQPPAPQQQPPATQQQGPVAGQHQQSAGPPQQPPAPQQQPPATAQQQPPAPQQQPPATAHQPPAGGSALEQGAQRPADQQAQSPPSQPLPQSQSGVTTRPPATLQTQPPQPPQEPTEQRETATATTGVTPDGQHPRQGRAGESESNAAETPAENS